MDWSQERFEEVREITRFSQSIPSPEPLGEGAEPCGEEPSCGEEPLCDGGAARSADLLRKRLRSDPSTKVIELAPSTA